MSSTHLEEGYVVRNKNDEEGAAKITTCVRPPYFDDTVWKFQDFCISQILREINFEDS